MKKYLMFVILAVSMPALFSCEKDEVIEITPEERAKLDDELIVDYLKTHKKVSLENNFNPAYNINWKIETFTGEDKDAGTKNLFDLMGDSYITETFDDVSYKVYYYGVSVGSGADIAVNDTVVVDYVLHDVVYSSMMQTTADGQKPVQLALSNTIAGFKLALNKFKVGTKPSTFNDYEIDPYREKVEKPGKGIIFIPSGMAYGPGSEVLRYDIVLYDNKKKNE